MYPYFSVLLVDLDRNLMFSSSQAKFVTFAVFLQYIRLSYHTDITLNKN